MSDGTRIVRIEWGRLEGQRPRWAGSNARLGDHGSTIHLPLIRLTTADGATGFGPSWAGQEQAERLLGVPLSDAFLPQSGVPDAWRGFEFPLWDLAGQCVSQPVYQLCADIAGRDTPSALRVPAYDTSLYFDDLHLDSTEEAAALIASEAREGYDGGHRAFKIKVGRGARHMAMDAGTKRDIAVIRAVREAVGPDCRLLLDANNGYNLNLAKHVLAETADVGIHWLEEAFHEDAVLYRDLKAWLAEHGLTTLIADGEGDANPHLMRWAQEGLVDVIQYDIFGHGLTRWLQTGRQLDSWNARSAPHHYGGHYGNYATCHLAPALHNFTLVEWDEAVTPGLDTSAYSLQDGFAHVPDQPGFGLTLEEEPFRRAVTENGWTVQSSVSNSPLS
jgi:L-rhamnonate dehydratase